MSGEAPLAPSSSIERQSNVDVNVNPIVIHNITDPFANRDRTLMNESAVDRCVERCVNLLGSTWPPKEMAGNADMLLHLCRSSTAWKVIAAHPTVVRNVKPF